jgi:hypothetical protein
MDRYVIKGRGPNRGKYLCYARLAPEEKPTEDGFVWLPDQRKAARWSDPRYSGRTWSTERARLHNGYFVKLVTPKAITDRVDDLRSYITKHAGGAPEELDCCWISGANENDAREASRDLDYTGWNEDYIDGEGTDFCGDCIGEVIDALRALIRSKRPSAETSDDDDDDDCGISRDGGWDTDHDSPPYCAKCGAKLSGHLTEYGADEELSALTSYAAPNFDEPNGWRDLDNAITNLSDDDPRWRKIAKVVEAARGAEREHKERIAALAVSPGMPEARGDFIALLIARREQKAPEPSFKLWNEMMAWRMLPYEERPDDPKSFIKEAKKFADTLGYDRYWSGGTFIIKAPYGDYHWPFIVKIEQWKLWQPAPFNEGRAFGLNPRKPYRDANPYDTRGKTYHAPMTIEAMQWDAGYILGCHERDPSKKAG